VQRVLDIATIVAVQYAAVAFYRQLWTESCSLACAVTIAVFGLVAEVSSLYRARHGEHLGRELTQVMVVWLVVLAMLLMVAFATKTSAQFSRIISTLWMVSAAVMLASTRVVIRLILRRLRKRGYNSRQAAIVGCTPLAERIIKVISNDPTLGLNVIGVYDDRIQPRQLRSPALAAQVLGNVEQLVADARAGKIDHVYLALPLRAEARVTDILHRLADTTATVYFVPDFFVFDLLHARMTSVGDVPVISVFDSPFLGVDGWVKRAEDIVLGLLALVAACVPMLIVAIAIKLNSAGPVLFRQRRYGLSGREIHVFKFRTMTVTEDGSKVRQATKGDQRITAVGAFLRRSSLDELPQLFNVIGGTMSLVGPRPHAVAHNEQYRSLVHNYMLRHKVKPGITGWAQVHGWRGETDTTEKMQKRVEHDLYYIQNWHLGLDVKILWMTVFGRHVRENAF
jgi:putative colanic acid biosynthesis UDP-glucose lipid carrier transferase